MIYSYLPTGVKSIGIEVYDECALTMDELIAYGQIPIPEPVFRQESVDHWFQLSGKQGENKEGSMRIIFSLLVISKYYSQYFLAHWFNVYFLWFISH